MLVRGAVVPGLEEGRCDERQEAVDAESLGACSARGPPHRAHSTGSRDRMEGSCGVRCGVRDLIHRTPKA